MDAFLDSPILWLTLSIFAFDIGLYISRRLRTPLANPLLIATTLLGIVLVVSGTPLTVYNRGGQWISLFLTPATIALAVPIYRQLETLTQNLLPILLGAVAGAATSMVSVYVLCHLFGLSTSVTASLLPKSVTTPIGVEIAETLGGIPSITAISIILTGLIGAVALPAYLKKIGMSHPVSIGIAIGTASHAVGTARAIELGETEGAMSSLAIGIAGLSTALIASFLTAIL